MNYQDAQIGQQVVRSKSDYVVGRIGEIINKDDIRNRVQVAWEGYNKTWVSVQTVELTSIPYEILPGNYDKTGRRLSWDTYKKK